MLSASNLSSLKLTDAQRSRLNAMMGQTIVPSRASVNDPWTGQAEYDQGVLNEAQGIDRTNRSMASHNKMVNVGRVASAIPLAFAAAPALGMGGGAGATTLPSASMYSGVSAGGGAGATGGIMARLGSIFGSKGFETVANGALALTGMKSQNKANAQARMDTLANQAKQIELAQAQLTAQTQAANLDRADAKALNDAMQKLEAQKIAIQQEQAQFERGIVEKDQAVKDNYRSTIQGPAAARLRSILGF